MNSGSLALPLAAPAGPARPAGAGYYIMELARRLCLRADIDLTMVSRRGDEERWEGLAAGAALVVGAVPVSRPGRLLFEQTGFPRLLGSLGVRVHHAPHYTMPER